MEEIILPEIKTISEDENHGVFVIEPLYPGYGQSLGNPLRRVLLSSLEGAAISSIKIEGVSHEFSAIPGVKEDAIEVILNLKQIRLKLFGDEPATMKLAVKGPKEVRASDIKTPSQVEIKNKDLYIATVNDNKHSLIIEMFVEKGRGYVPAESKPEKPDIGIIQVDSLFSPVLSVNFHVENTRVGQRTDFDKLTIDIKTDGTILPKEALKKAAEILVSQFKLISDMPIKVSGTEKKGKGGSTKAKTEKNEKKIAKKKRSKKGSA